jgi:hypothetical protein
MPYQQQAFPFDWNVWNVLQDASVCTKYRAARLSKPMYFLKGMDCPTLKIAMSAFVRQDAAKCCANAFGRYPRRRFFLNDRRSSNGIYDVLLAASNRPTTQSLHRPMSMGQGILISQ